MPVSEGCKSVIEHLAASDQGDEVCHHHGRRAFDLQESEQTEGQGEAECPDRNALFGAPGEDARCVALKRHAM